MAENLSRKTEIIIRYTIADAIMDRLTAGDTHRIELKGDSLRRKKQKQY